MAPEQLSGKEVSTQSDIYALGVVLYEMFTGKRPFRPRAPSWPSCTRGLAARAADHRQRYRSGG